MKTHARTSSDFLISLLGKKSEDSYSTQGQATVAYPCSTTLRNKIYFKWEDGKPVDKTVDKITTRDGSDIHIVGGNFLKGLSLSETKAYWKNQAKNQAKDMPP